MREGMLFPDVGRCPNIRGVYSFYLQVNMQSDTGASKHTSWEKFLHNDREVARPHPCGTTKAADPGSIKETNLNRRSLG